MGIRSTSHSPVSGTRSPSSMRRERAILLIRLAAAALGSTLVLLAGEGVLSLAAAVLLLYLAAAVVLRYSRISQGPTFIGPAIDLVAITALVFAFPLGASPWVLYAFPIGSSSLRFGPLGAIIATAASVVGLDLAFAARVDQARAIDLWAVQALIAIGLVTAEIAWALGRETADVLWSRLHARALGTLLRQRGHDELIRSVVGELARLPHVRGSWVWSLGTDQRLRLLASAG